MPPCAQSLALSLMLRLLTKQTFLCAAVRSAMVNPARPLPMISTSNCCMLGLIFYY